MKQYINVIRLVGEKYKGVLMVKEKKIFKRFWPVLEYEIIKKI